MKKCALTIGCFDVFHRGHLELLQMMNKEADYVVVMLHDDMSIFENKGAFPIQYYNHRNRNLIMTALVDSIEPVYNADPSDDLNRLLPTLSEYDIVYIRGDDWTDFPGKAVLEKHNVPIIFKQYTEGVSSTDIKAAAKKKR